MSFSSVLSEGDTGKNIILTMKTSQGAVVDVSGANVTFFFKHSDATATSRSGVVRDGPNGLVQYTLQDGDLIPGHLQIQASIELGGATIYSSHVNTRVLDKVWEVS